MRRDQPDYRILENAGQASFHLRLWQHAENLTPPWQFNMANVIYRHHLIGRYPQRRSD